MIRQVLLSCVLLGSLGAADTWAQQPAAAPRVAATVKLGEPVIAGGKALAAGTYEIVVNDARPEIAGQSSDAQRTVEFRQNGTVVTTEIAEVFPFTERPVGTSGAKARAVVQRLKSGDFIRIAVTGADARYLIHLPTGSAPVQP